MIGFLEGKLREKSPEHVLLDVNGVGYIVQISPRTFCELPDSGARVELHVHTHVREGVLELYGFRTRTEKEMFLHLITVNGIGPRLGVNILSNISPEDLRRVVVLQDPGRLKSIPGIGRKIAERILLELRDKLKIKKEATPEPVLVAVGGDAFGDAFSALVNLGYKPAEAEKALRRVQKEAGTGASIEQLLKEALRALV